MMGRNMQLHHFEPDWQFSFLLKYDCPGGNSLPVCEIANFQPNQVTSPQFAIYREVEQSQISAVAHLWPEQAAGDASEIPIADTHRNERSRQVYLLSGHRHLHHLGASS